MDSITDTIGHTPLVALPHCSPNPDVHLYAKLEGINPTGSVKDRIALEMVLGAERTGDLPPGATLVAASTGNTGISLAMIGRARGYRVHVVVPENISQQIPPTLSAYGATIQQVPAAQGMRGAIRLAHELAQQDGWFDLDQFSDPLNVRAHHDGTGSEILDDLPHVDVFVAGLGTGGTLMGVGGRLKEANPSTQVVAVEPHPGNQVQGLKSLDDGFIPPILDFSLLDGKILVRDRHAFRATSELMRREAIFAGVSSGAVLHAARRAHVRRWRMEVPGHQPLGRRTHRERGRGPRRHDVVVSAARAGGGQVDITGFGQPPNRFAFGARRLRARSDRR
jgi:cysteine synthase B